MNILKKTRFVWLMRDDDGLLVNAMPSLIYGLIIGNVLVLAIVIIMLLTN